MMHFFLSKICFTLEHYCIFHWLAGIVEGAYRIAAAGRLARADTQLFAYNVVRESNKAGVGKEEVDTCVCVCVCTPAVATRTIECGGPQPNRRLLLLLFFSGEK